MEPSPLVTIVVPCLNQAHYLRAALNSVNAQTYPRVEAIVVDDGSSDATAEVAVAAGALVFRQANLGVSAARNHGLRAADGDYVLFLDADDELLPNAVSTGVSVLERHADATMVARQCSLIDSSGSPLPTSYQPPASDDLYGEWLVRNLSWTPGAVLFRRRALLDIGGFPEDLGPAADYSVYLTLARSSRVLFDNRAVVRYRQHDSNMSRDAARMLRATLAVLRRERRHLPPGYRRRYRAGLRAWRTYYGEQIIQQMRHASRTGGVTGDQLRNAALLLSACPGVVLTNVGRKLHRVLLGHPPAPVEPGRFTPEQSRSEGSARELECGSAASVDGPPPVPAVTGRPVAP
jgi:glycosyltransferase involved in cell wall biosynthesis